MLAANVQSRSQRHEEVLVRCEGFCLSLTDGQAGVVDEVWLGAGHRPAALRASLPGRRQVVVTVDQIARVDPGQKQLSLVAGAELVELFPP